MKERRDTRNFFYCLIASLTLTMTLPSFPKDDWTENLSKIFPWSLCLNSPYKVSILITKCLLKISHLDNFFVGCLFILLQNHLAYFTKLNKKTSKKENNAVMSIIGKTKTKWEKKTSKRSMWFLIRLQTMTNK